MPVDRSFAEGQEKTLNLAAEIIGKYLAKKMVPNLAYSRGEVQEMIDQFATEDKELGYLVKNVPWYKFIGGLDSPLVILAGSSDNPYYAVRKK